MPDRIRMLSTRTFAIRYMPGITICRTIVFVPILLIGATAWACAAAPVENTLARRLSGDAADGQLDQFSLLQAALIAGGVSTEMELTGAIQQFEGKSESLIKKIRAMPAGDARVQATFDGLHRHFLYGDYRAEYSDVHRTLSDGHFNCVTATILFRCLCQRLNVPSEVVAATGHVLCRVPEAANQLIETTCPECHSLERPFVVRRGVIEAELRVISDVELIGKVYYNRGVASLEAKNFPQATDLLANALQFDPKDRAARDNLLAVLNNWALAACDEHDFELASRLLARGLVIDPSYAPLQTNDLHIHQQWVKHLCSRQQFERAIEVIDAVIERKPDSKTFIDGRLFVHGLWAESLFVQHNSAAAWRTLERARKHVGANSSDILPNLEVTAVLAAAEKLSRAGQPKQAAALLDQARIPASKLRLEQEETANEHE